MSFPRNWFRKRYILFEQVLNGFLAPTFSYEDTEVMKYLVRRKAPDICNNGIQLTTKVKVQLDSIKKNSFVVNYPSSDIVVVTINLILKMSLFLKKVLRATR
jgi:hypothetical protein